MTRSCEDEDEDVTKTKKRRSEDEEAEEEVGGGGGGGGGDGVDLTLKSSNPHLTGGKQSLRMNSGGVATKHGNCVDRCKQCHLCLNLSGKCGFVNCCLACGNLAANPRKELQVK